MTQAFDSLKNENGLITTLNQMGYMFEYLGECGEMFIDYCKKVNKPVLDVAAAFGTATIPALATGVNVIANDIEPKHLNILKTRVPTEYLPRLQLKLGKYPEELDFPSNSLGAILVSHVWHFLSGNEILSSIQKMYDWLTPGGKIYIITGTPYIQFVKDFIPTFLERKKKGVPWPGFIEDISIFNHPRAKDLPKSMNYMDDEILAQLFNKSQFSIEYLKLLGRPDFPPDMRLDGRETVGAVLRKNN